MSEGFSASYILREGKPKLRPSVSDCLGTNILPVMFVVSSKILPPLPAPVLEIVASAPWAVIMPSKWRCFFTIHRRLPPPETKKQKLDLRWTEIATVFPNTSWRRKLLVQCRGAKTPQIYKPGWRKVPAKKWVRFCWQCSDNLQLGKWESIDESLP